MADVAILAPDEAARWGGTPPSILPLRGGAIGSIVAAVRHDWRRSAAGGRETVEAHFAAAAPREVDA